MAIIMRSKTTVYGLTTDLATLQTNIDNEVTRATGVEGTLASLTTAVKTNLVAAINSEVTRATGVEGTLASLKTTVKTDLVSAINEEFDTRAAAVTTLQGNIDAVASNVSALGNAFNYVGPLTGGVDIANAFDLATLAADTKDPGDYYKVTTAGYFKVGAGAEFYANLNDGLVWNLAGGVDKIDNTDSTVAGTTDFITVTGAADTGFIVTIADTFKTRVSTLESGLAAEISRAAGVEGILANLTTDVKTDLVSAINSEVAARKASGTLPMLEMRTVTDGKIVLSNAPQGGVNGIMNFATVRYIDGNGLAFDAPVTLDGADATGKTFVVSTDTAGQWNTFSVAVQYVYAVTV